MKIIWANLSNWIHSSLMVQTLNEQQVNEEVGQSPSWGWPFFFWQSELNKQVPESSLVVLQAEFWYLTAEKNARNCFDENLF